MNSNSYSKAYVYHCSSGAARTTSEGDIEYCGIRTGELGALGNPLRFVLGATGRMHQEVRDGDHVILVGTVTEAAVGIVVRLLWRRKLRVITWVRGIADGELAADQQIVRVGIARVLERLLFAASSDVVFNGHDTYDVYSKRYPHLMGKYAIIPNGVQLDPFLDIELPSFAERPMSVAFVGRLVKPKGFHEFLSAVSQYNIMYPNSGVEFHVWGPNLMPSAPLDQVHYHGSAPREEIPAILARCHAVVILNQSMRMRAGGLSHSLLEAMAAGRLIIAWDNPAHRQVLNHSNSILVPEGSVDELVGAIRGLLDEGRSLREKALCAREDARAHSIENHVRTYLRLCVEQAPPARCSRGA
jgi:glycosyltransferase involved in cell wall biosynthesis